jgi:hypothetical protein
MVFKKACKYCGNQVEPWQNEKGCFSSRIYRKVCKDCFKLKRGANK